MKQRKKMWKEKKKRWSRWFCRYINGTKGVISIFLAICMLSGIAVDFLLVESVRYQSAIEMLEELADHSALSALADYDSYLEDRFGLLSLSQKENAQQTFSEYMEENLKIAGKSATVTQINAMGAYPLSDTGILKQQILEYSEVMGPTEAIYDIGDIKELIQKFSDGMPDVVQTLADNANITGKTADLMKELSDVVRVVKDADKTGSEYEEKYKNYVTAYEKMESAILIYVRMLEQKNTTSKQKTEAVKKLEELKKQESVQKEQETFDGQGENQQLLTPEEIAQKEQEEARRKKELQDAKKTADQLEQKETNLQTDLKKQLGEINDAKEKYRTSAAELSEKTEKEVSTLKTLLQASSKLSKKLEEVDSSINSAKDNQKKREEKQNPSGTKGQGSTDKTTSQMTETFQVIQEITYLTEKLRNSECIDNLNAAKNQLDLQRKKLRLFAPDQEITDVWTAKTVNIKFGPVKKISFGDILYQILETVNGIWASQSIARWEDILELLDLLEGILELDTLYDPALNAEVSLDSFYNGSVPESRYAQDLSDSTKAIFNAIDHFSAAITGGIVKKEGAGINNVLDYLLATIDLLKGVTSFFKAMVHMLQAVFGRIKTMFTQGGKELYNSFLLTTYGIYNFPCRTSFEMEGTLTGYSYRKIFDMAGGKTWRGGQLAGSLIRLELGKEQTVPNKLFYGAESEYLIAGATSEIDNQVAVSCFIYLLRFMLDVGPILSDDGLNAMAQGLSAATLGVGGSVLMAVVLIAEPMLDTFMLVNGGEEYLYKDQIYLSPKGIPVLIEHLSGVVKASQKAKDNLKERATSLKEQYKKAKKASSDNEENKEEEKASSGNEENKNAQSGSSSGDQESEKTQGDGSANTAEKKKTNWFKMDYKENLMLIMFVTVDPTTLLQRMQNLIQMECRRKYQASYDFDLNKTYTYLQSELTGILNPMLPADRLTENGLFTFHHQQYTGY